MGTRISIVRSGTSVVLAIVMAQAAQTHGAGGYLATVGPVPLRIQTARTVRNAVLPPLPAEPGSPANTAAPVQSASANTPLDTSAFLIPGSPLESILRYLSSARIQFGTVPSQSSQPANHIEELAPAADLLIITPQMLVDYFKPVPGSTNATVVVPVTFTPPTSAAPARSRATYNSQ